MANTRIGGGKPAKGSVRTAAKAHKKAGPARDFSAELVKAGKPGQAPKKPSPQSSGPEIVESDTGVTRHLEILGSKRAGTQRTVEITGSVSRFNKHGDIVDGGLAHAGRVTKSATVTVTVRDQTGTTTRSYKGSEVRPTTVEIGSQTTDVKVRGTFGGSVAVLPGRPGRYLFVDAEGSAFTGRDPRTKALHAFSFTSSGGSRKSETYYWGSTSRDNVHIQSHGKVRVTGGPGDDVIMARGGRDSLVEGGDGNDVIGTFGRRNVLESRTRYRGGEGRNTFGLVDHGKADQVMDFDPAKDEFHTPE